MHDEQPVPWIELAQSGAGAVSMLMQGAARQPQPRSSAGTRPERAYDWSETDNAVLAVVSGSQTAKVLAFSPATLPPGAYNLALRVERTIGAVTSPASVVRFTFNVAADVPAADIAELTATACRTFADDNDGTLGFANTLQGQAAVRDQAAARAFACKSAARRARCRPVPSRAARRHRQCGRRTGRQRRQQRRRLRLPGRHLRFRGDELAGGGRCVQIVIPQSSAIGEFPEYRKYLPGPGWSDFMEDDQQPIESARRQRPQLPAARR